MPSLHQPLPLHTLSPFESRTGSRLDSVHTPMELHGRNVRQHPARSNQVALAAHAQQKVQTKKLVESLELQRSRVTSLEKANVALIQQLARSKSREGALRTELEEAHKSVTADRLQSFRRLAESEQATEAAKSLAARAEATVVGLKRRLEEAVAMTNAM